MGVFEKWRMNEAATAPLRGAVGASVSLLVPLRQAKLQAGSLRRGSLHKGRIRHVKGYIPGIYGLCKVPS